MCSGGESANYICITENGNTYDNQTDTNNPTPKTRSHILKEERRRKCFLVVVVLCSCCLSNGAVVAVAIGRVVVVRWPLLGC